MIEKINRLFTDNKIFFSLLLVITWVTNVMLYSVLDMRSGLRLVVLFTFFVQAFVASVWIVLLFSVLKAGKSIQRIFLILNYIFSVVFFYIAFRFPEVEVNALFRMAGEVDIVTSLEFVLASLMTKEAFYAVGMMVLCMFFGWLFSHISFRKTGYVFLILSLYGTVFWVDFARKDNYPLWYGLTKDACPLVRTVSELVMLKEVSDTDETIITYMKSKKYWVKEKGSHPDIVVIVGESATRNRMGVYGYPLNTTPFLSSAGAILWKTRCSYPGTADNLKVLFSSLKKDDGVSVWKEKQQLFPVLKDTVYKTYWISNQQPQGYYGSTEHVISSFAGESWFAPVGEYDEILLPRFRKIWENMDSKLVVLHLMGSHMWFPKRYPPDFAKFTVKDELLDDASKNKVRAEYDNTLLYTDYIIQQVMDIVKDRNVIVVYLSDHGCTAYGKNDTVGHVLTDDPDMWEIPFMFLATDKFKTEHGDIWNSLKDIHYDTSDKLYELLLYLSGYEVSN